MLFFIFFVKKTFRVPKAVFRSQREEFLPFLSVSGLNYLR